MEKIKGIIYACISAGTFGMIPLFANTAMREGVNNDTILVYRYVIAALVYGVYLAFRNISLKINRETLIELLWAGVGGYGITAYFLFLSYRYMPTGIATSIHYLYPVVVAVFMSLFYKQHLSIRVKGAHCSGYFRGIFYVLERWRNKMGRFDIRFTDDFYLRYLYCGP